MNIQSEVKCTFICQQNEQFIFFSINFSVNVPGFCTETLAQRLILTIHTGT